MFSRQKTPGLVAASCCLCLCVHVPHPELFLLLCFCSTDAFNGETVSGALLAFEDEVRTVRRMSPTKQAFDHQQMARRKVCFHTVLFFVGLLNQLLVRFLFFLFTWPPR